MGQLFKGYLIKQKKSIYLIQQGHFNNIIQNHYYCWAHKNSPQREFRKKKRNGKH